ncbi:MAG: M20/M25/M40 family metallo-hydrolase, partial [Bryobacteraceae bacterium]|nr:M20/M25/M40 family metallo-hydrolase [Bryobacteraceae bacterium]
APGGAGAALFAEAAAPAALAAGVAAWSLSPQEQLVLAGAIGEPALGGLVARYSGAKPVSPAAGHILSRHIDHTGNAAAVAALAAELNTIGAGRLTIRRQRFTHEGKRHENVEASLGANGLSGIVILSAHLDSTAKDTPPYRPSADPAPGADDDASGIAAILAAAGAILALAAALPAAMRREIRLVLFNAEEQGLIGSRAYARELSQEGTEVVAAFQLDMIGHSTAQVRGFELHAGFTASAEVQRRSVQLAELVQAMCGQFADGGLAPQVFPGAEPFDPGEGRSDHYSFHLEGYPACLISEDFFAGPGPTGPPANPNPNYHQATDTTINEGYAAAISRAVTAAAWVAATR